MTIYSTFERYKFGNYLRDTVGYSEQTGQVVAQYYRNDGSLIYVEEIGKVKMGRLEPGSFFPTIQAIADRHLKEVSNTLEHIKLHKFIIEESLEDGMFKALRETASIGRQKEEAKAQEFEDYKSFIQAIENRMMNDYYIKANALGLEIDDKTAPWQPIRIEGNKACIRDVAWPLEATLARLLLINPYSKIPYPDLPKIVEDYARSYALRLNAINFLLKSNLIFQGKPVTDYELYFRGELVFSLKGNILNFRDKELFHALCSPPPVIRLDRDKVDQRFIDNVIAEGFVHKESEYRLKKLIGKPFHDAMDETRVYGNRKRRRQINEEEVDALEGCDTALFYAIYYMCEKIAGKQDKFGFKPSFEAWEKIKQTYKWLSGGVKDYQQFVQQKVKGENGWTRYERVFNTQKQPGWLQLKKVRNYLDGREKLQITQETAPELLRIAKMFDLATALLNCSIQQKLAFAKGSYELRERILEIRSDYCSYDVFSRTLFHQRLNNILYLADQKHWCDRRVGLQAHLIANTHVLALSLSQRLGPVIVGGRGNTGAGKSTVLGKQEGTLNTDPIKWGLRKDTEVKNRQVHLEGATLFDLYFDEIEKDITIHYILDLRLIQWKDIEKYLIEPARKRKCPVVLKDLDVSLLTSINRVLNRQPNREDPIPGIDPIKSGFKNLRIERADVIEKILNEPTVQEYTLYFQGKVVASKKDGAFEVFDRAGFVESLRVPSDLEIEESLDSVINEAYVQTAIERGDLHPLEAEKLLKWEGKTVREAITRHAL